MAGANDKPVMMLDTEDGAHATSAEINVGESGVDPKKKPKPNMDAGGSAEHEVDENGAGGEHDDATTTEANEEGSESAEGTDQEDAEGKGDETADVEDLGAFDPNDADVATKFDEAYLTPENGPNLERLGAEWNAKGTLNDGTFEYLKDRFGLSKEQVNTIAAGQVALRDASLGRLHALAGNKETFDAAVAWGAKNYTPAQKAKFNATFGGSDGEAQAEATEALMARYRRANPRLARQTPPRRPAGPQRNVTESTKPAMKVTPYANIDEYRADFRAARAAKDNKAVTDARRRLYASPFYTGTHKAK